MSASSDDSSGIAEGFLFLISGLAILYAPVAVCRVVMCMDVRAKQERDLTSSHCHRAKILSQLSTVMMVSWGSFDPWRVRGEGGK